MQRRVSLGGPDLLPGYDFREFTCAPRGFDDPRSRRSATASIVRAGRRCGPGSDSISGYRLAQTARESRSGRFIGIEEADLVFLSDVGKGWLAGDGPGQVPVNRIPAFDEWKVDVGVGLDAGEIGAYLAKGLTAASRSSSWSVFSAASSDRSPRRHVPGARRAWAALVALSLGAAGALPAQELPPVHLDVRLTSPAAVRLEGTDRAIENLLGDDRWLSALRSGLPVRLHYRLEVWRSREGWFDNFERQTEWDVVVRHEPLLDQYTLLTLVRRTRRRSAATPRWTHWAPRSPLPIQVNVGPTEPGRYYYAATLEVSTLSDSDLDELERFLEGDLGDVRRKGEIWEMHWAGERLGFCCGWRACRA